MERLQAPQVAAPAETVHGETGTVTLRIFVDRSILEVYCGGPALTDRLVSRSFATGLDLLRKGRISPRQDGFRVTATRHLVTGRLCAAAIKTSDRRPA